VNASRTALVDEHKFHQTITAIERSAHLVPRYVPTSVPIGRFPPRYVSMSGERAQQRFVGALCPALGGHGVIDDPRVAVAR